MTVVKMMGQMVPAVLLATVGLGSMCKAQNASATVPGILTLAQGDVVYGPYNASFLEGGLGLTKPLQVHEPLATAQAGWSMSLWLKTDEVDLTALVAGIGRPDESTPRYLALRGGRPAFWAGGQGPGHELVGGSPLSPGTWHALAVWADTDGKTHLYADGTEVAMGVLPLGPAADVFKMAPPRTPAWPDARHFGGWLAQVSLRTSGFGAEELRSMTTAPAGLDNLPFEEGSKPWPVQTRGQRGMAAPQDPSLLPHSRAAAQQPKAVPPLPGTDEASEGGSRLVLRHGWQLADVAEVKAGGAEISTDRFGAGSPWMAATVPGTVLTTLIDRGVYPDPDFGLNNMAIPESLSKKSFWYREVFTPPAAMRGRHLTLRFHGINYRATVWVNGKPVGEIVGAFLHKGLDVTPYVRVGEKNVVAVRIDPPPHGGIAHEQSLAAGSGDNGGMMMLDGPTFGATEGWDWIPGIRDRNMGLWQDVTLEATGTVAVQVPQIITRLPLPDRSRAEITVRVPLKNEGNSPVRGTVEIAFDDVHVTRSVTVPTAGATVELAPKEFQQLSVRDPKLWWPNGYGEQALHRMKITFKAGGKISDTREERFGIREITYEISAFDTTGHLRRVEVSPTEATLAGRGAAVQQSHEGFRETPAGWVTSLVPGMENSPAVKPVDDPRAGTALVIRVNGVKIACKGGAWGMDDIRKRVSRERLEPYFRLHKEANLTMIRNWMGQNTEDIFFDLADEYGLLVWSDFWDSTQDWNLEPDDAGLFLENAKDTIDRYRNHPSIAIWCGRNEGVPPPAINEGLDRLITQEDGTRYYSADSNKINLHDSGPYKYQEPEDYFTKLSLGFAVEVGLPSPPTMETWQTWLAKEDQWPISDAWAYHDWHQGGNGDTAPFMQTMIEQFGAPTSLADFDRKAQMMNYDGHRAVIEGFNAHLWTPNSGRLLWMTQPAWPSSVWQIFSHDYDTQASFYAVKKASEAMHVQMNLPAHDVIVVNNSEQPMSGLEVTARVFDTASKQILEKKATVTASANATTPALAMELQGAMEAAGVVLVKLELKDAAGKLLSDNFYWQAARKADYRKMDDLPTATLTASVKPGAGTTANGDRHALVTLVNGGTGVALAAKLTLQNAATGERVLPAYYSDNYVSILPGETKTIDIAYPATSARGAVKVGLRGWNVTPASISVTP
jgi:hypothetical protein